MRDLRVLFLTRYPNAGASSRYRVHQYIPFLEQQGVRCEVQSFMDDAMYGLSMRPGHTWRKIFGTVRACARRFGALRSWRRHDIIYLQRELLPFGPPLLESWLRRRGAVLFYDYDDALFIKKPSRYNPLATLLRSAEKTLRIMRTVDCVVAGNDWLRDAAAAQGAHAVTVEVAEDTGRFPARPPHDGTRPVTIGWLGSPSTVKYLALIAPVLREVARRHPYVRFELMGGGEFEMQGVPWETSEWSLDGEVAALGRFDIGLMPLPSEDWARGKSGGKARTYMAAGVVPVCTAIGYNLQLIRSGATGFLCGSEDEWLSTLSRLIEDSALRRQVSIAARQDVELRFAPARQAGLLRDLFADVLRRRNRL